MLDKIYNARFFDKQSGVEITIDDARVKGQNTTMSSRTVYMLYKNNNEDKYSISEGIVFDNYFHELITALVGPYISSKHSKIETVGTVCNLEKQVADMPIKFCVAFKHYHKGHNKQDVYGTFPHFVFEYENIKDHSCYEFYIFYFEENNDSHCGLIHVALIEGNIIVDMNGNTYKIVGLTKITCS